MSRRRFASRRWALSAAAAAALLAAGTLDAAPAPPDKARDDQGKAQRRRPTTAPAETAGVRIAGTVVDEVGEPLAGALVSARTPSMGRLLWWAFKPAVRTDAKGRFDLPLPFAEIPYTVSASRIDHIAASVKVFPEHAGDVRLTLRRREGTAVIRGTVLGPGSRPAADVAVRLIGEYGRRAEARTNQAGEFALTSIPPYIGQAVPLVRSDGLVVPLRIVRSKDKQLRLSLAKPGRLKGVARDKSGGRPVPGATVLIRPWFASDFRMRATCAEDGQFELGGIPPGKYKVTAVAATHFIRPPRGMDFELPEVTFAPGQVRERTLEMQRVATVRGRVLDRRGRSVAGALVGIRSSWLGDYRDQNRWVATDGQGRFAVATGHLDKTVPLVAYSARHGLARTQLPQLKSGQVHAGVVLELPGAARVTGTVTDPSARPLPDIVCLIEYPYSISARTGPRGRFDLGRISCPPAGTRPKSSAVFRAPRPKRGEAYAITYPFDSVSRAAASLDAAPQFYHHRRVELDLRADRPVELKVVLKPTELLEFRGTVVDPRGQPLAGAKVELLTGDATKESWLRTISSSRWGSSSLDLGTMATTLAATRTDKSGRWRILTVRENGEAMPMGSRFTDWKRYCIGVQTRGGNHVLVRDITVPAGERRREVKLSLAGAVPEVLATLLRLKEPPARKKPRPFAALQELTGEQFDSGEAAMVWWWRQPLARKSPAAVKLDAERMATLWKALGAEVSSETYEQALALAAGGQQAADFLARRLEPVPDQAGYVAKLVDDLDNERYAVRQRAYEGLCRIGRVARPALRKALAAEPSEELRQRAKELLAAWERPYPVLPDARRAIRAVRVLALIGSEQALRTLAALAKGMPGALLTEHARAALRRAKNGTDPSSRAR